MVADDTKDKVSKGSLESRVHWRALFDVAAEFLKTAEAPITIIAPFITPSVLRRLLEIRPVALVVTSWRPDLLVSGVSSLETYEVARDFGTTLVINDRLHAKVITGNFKSALVGSANVTAAALGLCEPANLEAIVELPSPSADLKAMLCRLLIDGRAVDDSVYARYKEWLSTVDASGYAEIPEAPLMPDSRFLVSQLPATSSPSQLWSDAGAAGLASDEVIHDLQLFGIEPDVAFNVFVEALRKAWYGVPFLSRIMDAINERPEGMYFGTVKELVQQISKDVPLPHRRDLTTLVQNIYSWVAELLPDEYVISRPNYSQLLRKRTTS